MPDCLDLSYSSIEDFFSLYIALPFEKIPKKGISTQAIYAYFSFSETFGSKAKLRRYIATAILNNMINMRLPIIYVLDILDIQIYSIDFKTSLSTTCLPSNRINS
jgi:hypothetical protein